MNSDLNLFLQAWTGGEEVSDAERQQLLGRIRNDANFRDDCVAEIRLLGLCKTVQSTTPRWLELSETLGINNPEIKEPDDFTLEVMDQITKKNSSRGTGILQNRQNWRPLTAAAAGLMIGLCSASLVWAVAGSTTEFKAKKVLLEGFESTGLTFEEAFPNQAGVWNGHQAAMVRSNSAASGQHVLQFKPKEQRKLSHINHIVDLSSLPRLSRKAQPDLRFFAKVRSIGDVESTHRYTLRVATFPEGLDQLKEQWFSGSYTSDTALTFASRSIKIKGTDWASIDATVPLPPEGQYVIVSIGVTSSGEDQSNLLHEVDALRLELISSEDSHQ